MLDAIRASHGLAIAGCEDECGARQRLLIHERMRGQMQHAILPQVSVSQERGGRIAAEPYLGSRRIPRDETRLARGPHELRHASHRGDG